LMVTAHAIVESMVASGAAALGMARRLRVANRPASILTRKLVAALLPRAP
jgi:glutamate 5-kinase